MSKLRLWIGVALMVAGGLAGARAFRAAPIGQTDGGPAPRVATETKEVAAEDAAAEAVALRAAELGPLNAALGDHVDGPTLLDLFESEDWWRPYRDEFPGMRLIIGETPLVSRGPLEGGTQDRELVSGARKRRVASGRVSIASKSYLVVAVRLSALPEQEPVLVLAKPAASPRLGAAAAAVTSVAGAAAGRRQIPWVVAGALALVGLGLALSGRGGRRDGAAVVAAVPVKEATLKFGTPARPQLAHKTGVATAPAVTRPPLASGNAVSVPSAPAAPPRSPSRVQAGPGAAFGRYKLLDRLGEGGMSEVFTAEATGVEGFSRTFVLKRLRRELAHDKAAVAQFIDEARMQSSLVHSNIVPVFDFGMVGNEYFITQEYIAGRDLLRLMTRYAEETGSRGLEPRVAYYIAYETLQALAYAHEKRDKADAPMGIVHRDVSPGNVIMSLQGEVKLSDFGIVKSNQRVTQTQVGMVKGNANFMSPEQARGLTVDSRSDLFSLGQVLYFLLTADLLYSGQNDLDVLYKAATGPSFDDFHKMHALPEPAGQILEKALAFDPRDRFQTAEEFAGMIAAHVGGGKGAAASLMHRLFGAELKHEAA